MCWQCIIPGLWNLIVVSWNLPSGCSLILIPLETGNHRLLLYRFPFRKWKMTWSRSRNAMYRTLSNDTVLGLSNQMCTQHDRLWGFTGNVLLQSVSLERGLSVLARQPSVDLEQKYIFVGRILAPIISMLVGRFLQTSATARWCISWQWWRSNTGTKEERFHSRRTWSCLTLQMSRLVTQTALQRLNCCARRYFSSGAGLFVVR